MVFHRHLPGTSPRFSPHWDLSSSQPEAKFSTSIACNYPNIFSVQWSKLKRKYRFREKYKIFQGFSMGSPFFSLDVLWFFRVFHEFPMYFPRFPRDFLPRTIPPLGAGHHRGVGTGAAEASRRARQVVGQGVGPGAESLEMELYAWIIFIYIYIIHIYIYMYMYILRLDG